MMAKDWTPEIAQLPSSTIDSLRSALRDYARGGQSEVAPSLREALVALADAARAKRIPAEQVLIILKDLWYAMPEVHGASGDQQNQLLQRVVTFCIREYYSS